MKSISTLQSFIHFKTEYNQGCRELQNRKKCCLALHHLYHMMCMHYLCQEECEGHPTLTIWDIHRLKWSKEKGTGVNFAGQKLYNLNMINISDGKSNYKSYISPPYLEVLTEYTSASTETQLPLSTPLPSTKLVCVSPPNYTSDWFQRMQFFSEFGRKNWILLRGGKFVESMATT